MIKQLVIRDSLGKVTIFSTEKDSTFVQVQSIKKAFVPNAFFIITKDGRETEVASPYYEIVYLPKEQIEF